MTKKLLTSFILLIVILFSSSSSGFASYHPDRISQIAHFTGEENNIIFGASLVLSGDILAVGDPYDSQAGEEAGSVTIFQSSPGGEWTELITLTASDSKAGDHFGRNLALAGDRLVVGAPFDGDYGGNGGSAYIFERNQGGADAWGQVARLSGDGLHSWDNFGWAVSVDGDTIVIGAYTSAPGGLVYIFERDAGGPGAWGNTAQLIADAPVYGAGFGEAVSLEGDILAIGAYAGGDYSGYVYIFQRIPGTTQWQRLTRFRATDTSAYHFFSYSLALDNWTILAGAPGADGLKGAAYIFTADPGQPDTWTERARLAASDGALGDNFAFQLDLSGDYALVGSPVHDSGAGAAYIYVKDQAGTNAWGEIAHLQGDDTQPGDEFAYWVAVDDHMAAAGAPNDISYGSAYLFDLNQPWLTLLPLVRR